MATALPSNPDLECCICCEQFKAPKILPCGHSFCLECLERWIGARKTFPCPVCKQNVKIPQGGVDKFTTNFSLKTLTDSSSNKPKHYCPNHSQKEVEYYCQTCNLGLCTKCIYRDHKDHKTLDLELDSTREKVVKELSRSEQFIKHKIEDLEKTLEGLLETSEKLKSFCEEACTKISEKTEKIIGELKENSKKRQQEIRNNFVQNESKLTETQQKVITQITNIKTDLDTSRPTTEEPSLTLIYSLTKLKDLQKLCENMKTDIPPVTYVEWREGSVKVRDILGSTVTIQLYQSNEGNVFKFNYKDIKNDNEYYSEDKCTSQGVVWSCCVLRKSYDRCLYIYIELLEEDNPLVEICNIEYTLTLLNKDKDKNVSKTRTERFTPGSLRGMAQLPWNKLTDPSEGFIDNKAHFFVRLDILQVLDIEYK